MKIGSTSVGDGCPAYFVADIAANHDGSLQRAVDLIHRCAEAGANAAKFQNFLASTIVSDKGFKELKSLSSHQSSWKKSVYDVYESASLSLEWTPVLQEECKKAGIDYFTAPYDLCLVDKLESFTCAWKVGSGDITWHELIEKLSRNNKPLLIATGASELSDVQAAMSIAQKYTSDIVLMQCNTNYTASLDNLNYVNLSVLRLYQKLFPGITLGLSDHTPGHSTVLGAIAFGAKVIEKHFTDDVLRDGPDHAFSMDPNTWSEMVLRSRELEAALGDGHKRVEANEQETYVLQRRAIRASRSLTPGTIISRDDITLLRPCPIGFLSPADLTNVIGRQIIDSLDEGDPITLDKIA